MDKYQPPFKITNEILTLVSEITELISNISYSNHLNIFPKLRRLNRMKSVHSTCAIEQNKIPLKEAIKIIEGKKTNVGTEKEKKEIEHAYKAYEMIDKIDPNKLEDLLKIHKVMIDDLAPESGKLRSRHVYVMDGNVPIHIGPNPKMVPSLMTQLFEWIKTADVHPLIKSTVFHYEFEFIHPFNDGNGRMGRYWQTLILSKWKNVFKWIPVESIIYKHQSEYYDAIKQSDQIGDSTIFITFILKVIKETVLEVINDSNFEFKNLPYPVMRLLNVLQNDSLSAVEIMAKLNIKSRDTLRNTYINPALKLKVIEQTEQNSKFSKNQRYRKVIKKKL
mgnify:CR=1 FL=1